MPEELWVEIHNFVQEVVIKTIPWKKKCKKAKWLCEEKTRDSSRKLELSREHFMQNGHNKGEVARKNKRNCLKSLNDSDNHDSRYPGV